MTVALFFFFLFSIAAVQQQRNWRHDRHVTFTQQ